MIWTPIAVLTAAFTYLTNSTVVIWHGDIGSSKDHAPLLGKYLRKDLVNRGTPG